MARRDHVLKLICIANQLAADGVVCRNLGDIQTAAMPYADYTDACDDIGIPGATCIVDAQYRFTVAKYEAANA